MYLSGYHIGISLLLPLLFYNFCPLVFVHCPLAQAQASREKGLDPCIRIWLRGIRRAGRNLTRNAIESVGKTLLCIKELS